MMFVRERSSKAPSSCRPPQVLPDCEELGAHTAGLSALAWRRGFMDKRRVVAIVVAIVREAQDAAFHHAPAPINRLLCSIGGVALLRHTREDEIYHAYYD
jgi:hypothetical protein